MTQKSVAGGAGTHQKYIIFSRLVTSVSQAITKEGLNFWDNFLCKCLSLCTYWVGSRLLRQYDEDTVAQMSEIIEGYDHKRIEEGLQRANKILSELPSSSKSLGGLAREDSTALQALFEALCCRSYHTFRSGSPELFDAVIRLIQFNKTLVLADLVPATTTFLFDANPWRRQFAVRGWTGTKTNQQVTSDIFTWVVHDALSSAMRSMSVAEVDDSQIQRFWYGVMVVIEKLDEELIKHSLRALEVSPDIYHLALESLRTEHVEILDLVIRTMHLLIQKSSKSFWDAYGSISPSVVAEQAFSSKAFQPLLLRNLSQDVHDPSNSALDWIPTFIRSLGPNQQYETCRTMLLGLFSIFENTKLPLKVRYEACRTGLDALSTTLSTFTAKEYKFGASTSFITINNILKLVDQHKGVVLQWATSEVKEDTQSLCVLGLDVVRLSILLDCKAFKAQFIAVRDGEAVHHDGLKSHSESLWQTIVNAFKPDDMAMAVDLLAGIEPLNPVDHFRPWKKDTRRNLLPLSKDEVRFEKDFGPMSAMITTVYERLSEFKPENLQELCKNQRHRCKYLLDSLLQIKRPTKWPSISSRRLLGRSLERAPFPSFYSLLWNLR